jgi:hypothetical protein
VCIMHSLDGASCMVGCVTVPSWKYSKAAAFVWKKWPDCGLPMWTAKEPALGSDFSEECQVALARIPDEPERWRQIRRENRKLNFHRFPLFLVFTLDRRNLRKVISLA